MYCQLHFSDWKTKIQKKKKNQDSEMKNPIPQNPEIAESDF